jgi:DNA-binding transcriptional LysR family regulator
LTTEHFLALPSIVKETDLAVVIPRNIAKAFAAQGGYALIDPHFPSSDFEVSLHWSRRADADAGNRWLRKLVAGISWE